MSIEEWEMDIGVAGMSLGIAAIITMLLNPGGGVLMGALGGVIYYGRRHFARKAFELQSEAVQ